MSTPPDPHDDRAPICPACGVTQFLVADGDEVEFVCVECGFSDERSEPDA
jgi:Zn ribbon nucleic-acid-binding protein